MANRGEIAVRVERTCRELGIESVAVYSTADAESRHVRMADRRVCIGPPVSAASYLNQEAIVAAAKISGADAVHPGYGFLAENAEFAALVVSEGLTWVGPSPDVIRTMGDKVEARRAARAAGVPTVPGSEGVVADLTEARRLGREIGYPLLLKAGAGGGGRGIRRVSSPDELDEAFVQASAEATAAFGNGGLYVERYLQRVRHTEVQIVGDRHGRVVHLGERDCSLQRRHQKLVEEAPSAVLTQEERRALGAAAVAIAEKVGYEGAGTVEFIFDEATREFFFIEMNTRIQVEHPVTELVTGVDLVAEQIRVAAGEPLSISQDGIPLRGHAVECRINAEDVTRGFTPCPGLIRAFTPPGGPGVRVDTHCHAGYVVPPFYDSLLAKLLVVAADRRAALRRMRRALDEFEIVGPATTIPLHRTIVDHPDFVAGNVHTRWVEDVLLPTMRAG